MMPRPLVFLILSLPLAGAYAMYACGIVVIHQASRVVNLAHGAMATIPAYVAYSLHKAGLPIGFAFPIALLSGALIGVGVERIFVRRLRSAGSTAQTVGTVAAFGVMISLAAKIWGTEGLIAPGVFPEGQVQVGSSALTTGQIGICVVAVVATLALVVLFRGTWLGLAMRGAAVNRRAASLMGVDPDATSVAAWAIGGTLAAAAGVLLAATTTLNPYSLSLSVLPAYVAALIGGLSSLGGALIGAAIVGLLIGFVPILAELPLLENVLGQVGGPQLVLAVAAMIVMAVRGRKLSDSEEQTTVPVAERPVRPKLPKPSPKVLLVLAIGWVFLPGVPFSILGDANQALIYTVAAASVVLLTGWIGQISLAQAAFVGIGAFASVRLASGAGIAFPFTLPIAGAIAAGAATVLGAVALRVRGLYLAVATLIFAWMADEYLFSAPWLAGAGGSAGARTTPIGVRGGFPYFDFSDRKTFYVAALAVAALVLVALGNIKRSKTGRAFASIRGSEVAAASLGIDVTRTKLLGFAMSGFIAGLAGNLIVVQQGTIVPAQFAFTESLFFLSIVVVGGLRSTGGAIVSSVVFALLNEVFFRVDVLTGWLPVVSSGLLAGMLIFYPGGLAKIPDTFAARFASLSRRAQSLRRRIAPPRVRAQRASVATAITARPRRLLGRLRRDVVWFGRELAASGASIATSTEQNAPAVLRPRVRAFRAHARGLREETKAIVASARRVLDRIAPEITDESITDESSAEDNVPAIFTPASDAALVAERITVRFGGLTAVEDVSLRVEHSQIVGLIGPNGAGKTTMFNAIAGFATPDGGEVRLQGNDVTKMSVPQRARLGMGRTFQQIQLASDLTVRENLLVATHTQNPTGVLGHMLLGSAAIKAERAAAERVGTIAWTLGIEDVLDRTVAGLPFGTLRMVELARAVVTGAPLLLLDEPASGLDEAETARLSTLLLSLRDERNLSILLIEHDVSLVMGLCDRIFVLDGGRLVAEGTPGHIRTNPAVIAAYLGTPV